MEPLGEELTVSARNAANQADNSAEVVVCLLGQLLGVPRCEIGIGSASHPC